MGLMGGAAQGGGGLGKVQHSPIKPTVVHHVQMETNHAVITPGEHESIAGLIGKSKAAQVQSQAQPPMQPPAMDHGESIGGLLG